ncbi:MAG: hypothetical protein ACTSUJ_05700 [Candidatus Njordarchaeales archaeon]
MEEETEFVISEELEEMYRPSKFIQIMLYAIVILLSALLIYQLTVEGYLEAQVAILIFLYIATLLFPIIIKFRSLIISVIRFGFFGATFLSTVYFVLITFPMATLSDVALLIIFLEVLFIELLHHISPRFRARRGKRIFILDGILTAIFFGATFIFLSFLGIIVGGVLSLLLSIVFFYAILPERPL